MLLRDCLFQGSNTQIFPNLENGRTYKEASKMQPVRSKNVFGNDQPTFLQTTSCNVWLSARVTHTNLIHCLRLCSLKSAHMNTQESPSLPTKGEGTWEPTFEFRGRRQFRGCEKSRVRRDSDERVQRMLTCWPRRGVNPNQTISLRSRERGHLLAANHAVTNVLVP